MNGRLILGDGSHLPATVAVALALTLFLLPAAGAKAADSTWQRDFDDSWHNSTNWTAGQPGAGDTAFFTTDAAGDSATPREFFRGTTSIGAITFQAGAPASTLAVDHTANPGAISEISGPGIANNSAHTQSILILGDVSLDQAGTLDSLHNATAGHNNLISNLSTILSGGSSGAASFRDHSTAGGATIINRGDGPASSYFGSTSFLLKSVRRGRCRHPHRQALAIGRRFH